LASSYFSVRLSKLGVDVHFLLRLQKNIKHPIRTPPTRGSLSEYWSPRRIVVTVALAVHAVFCRRVPDTTGQGTARYRRFDRSEQTKSTSYVSTPADRDSGPIVDDGSAHHWYICRVVIVESWKRLRAPLPVISQPYWENRSMARQF
jgi:hypothetical protein